MRFDPSKLRMPISVQVGVVAALFIAALVALWTTGASVVARERRRSEAKGMLVGAGDDLAARGDRKSTRLNSSHP
jgi:two-component system, NtrC family, sensor histidine kinase HydH